MIRSILNTWHKSNAAVVAQNLLVMHNNGAFQSEADVQDFAIEIVGTTWDRRPQVFLGRFGHRPGPVSIAAVALGEATLRPGATPLTLTAISRSLSTVLAEVEAGRGKFRLRGIDYHLLGEAAAVLLKFPERDRTAPTEAWLAQIANAFPRPIN